MDNIIDRFQHAWKDDPTRLLDNYKISHSSPKSWISWMLRSLLSRRYWRSFSGR